MTDKKNVTFKATMEKVIARVTDLLTIHDVRILPATVGSGKNVSKKRLQ
jgi:hypothetical protein